MKPVSRLFAISIAAALLVSCAQPERTAPPAKASLTSPRFTSVGKVTLHAGEPCTSQIMFDFRTTGKRSTIWLAAPRHESALLTEAANRNRGVQIWGTWRRSPDGTCNYVNVTKVQPASISVMF